jgi:uncharacterized protein YkwD
MKLILPVIAGFLVLAGAPAASAGGLDDAVLAEVNFVRAHPAEYARELRETDDRSGLAYEDPQALSDAIDFLERQDPLPPLRLDDRLSASAMAHTVAQGPRGQVGHEGAGGGLSQRLARTGMWAGLAAEDISYGYATPREIVRQLVVDSGVANRGHRLNIFGRAFQVAGVSCGDHSLYGAMCVIDFAGAVVER